VIINMPHGQAEGVVRWNHNVAGHESEWLVAAREQAEVEARATRYRARRAFHERSNFCRRRRSGPGLVQRPLEPAPGRVI
jgi:hypothetical protein